ncbi:EPHX4 [Symbiodinium natans]|uniref:EPHX4 protein n=1 Tax=Symbiodinium natans TaxID=878477 RepID=A0A812QIQ0_9DINO|nr:EPHX4 [Symbiodinium natans]
MLKRPDMLSVLALVLGVGAGGTASPGLPLTIFMERADGIMRDADPLGWLTNNAPDVMVKVFVGGVEAWTSTVSAFTPVWNERLYLPGLPGRDDPGELRFEVWDIDRTSPNDLLGVSALRWADVYPNGYSGSLMLQPGERDAEKFKRGSKLQLQVRVGGEENVQPDQARRIPPMKLAHSSLSRVHLRANGLTFTCVVCGEDTPAAEKKGNVLFLHGFPYFAYYGDHDLTSTEPIFKRPQEELCALGYQTLACNQRGYSEGASPEGIQNYKYELIKSDAWAMAEAKGFDTFHLVAHDHGAVVGWWMAASKEAEGKILSYTALSIPHLVPFSQSLTDERSQQRVQSQYFTEFVTPEGPNVLYAILGLPAYFDKIDGKSGSTFQKAVWWYNGAFGKGTGSSPGILSLPPELSATEIMAEGSGAARSVFASFRSVQGGMNGEAGPLAAAEPATNPIGKVAVPTLFACGKDDALVLCDTEYTRRTREYVTAEYQELVLPECDHNPLGEGPVMFGMAQPCAEKAVTATVEAMKQLILKATSSTSRAGIILP